MYRHLSDKRCTHVSGKAIVDNTFPHYLIAGWTRINAIPIFSDEPSREKMYIRFYANVILLIQVLLNIEKECMKRTFFSNRNFRYDLTHRSIYKISSLPDIKCFLFIIFFVILGIIINMYNGNKISKL